MPLKNLILKKIKKFNFSKYIYKIKINFKFIYLNIKYFNL